MDGDQFIPPPPPPEEPEKRKTGMRKIAATALLSVGLLAGTGVGSFVIAHAASSTPASSSSTLTASTATPSTNAVDEDPFDDDQVPQHGRLDQHHRLASLPPPQGGPPSRRAASPPLERPAVPVVEHGVGRIRRELSDAMAECLDLGLAEQPSQPRS